MTETTNASKQYYPVFRVSNVFKQLKSLKTPNNSAISHIFYKIFDCKSQKQFLFCQMLFDKELELMKECYPNKENGDKFYQALHSDFLAISNGGASSLPGYDRVASNIAAFLDSVDFNEAEQRIEIGKLQEDLNKIIERQKALLNDGKNPDGINKKLVLYAIDCLENVNLILKNFDKISIEFTVEEIAPLILMKHIRKDKDARQLFQDLLTYMSKKGGEYAISGIIGGLASKAIGL